MLDIRLIREDAETIKTRLADRGDGYGELVDQLLAIDSDRRTLETECQSLQGERNSTSKKIGAAKQAGEDTTEIEAAVREIGSKISGLNEQLDALAIQQKDLLLSIPNLPYEGCPVGQDETANPEVKLWGEKPDMGHLNGDPEDHVSIGERLNIFDFQAGADIAGSGFVVFRGAGAKLQRALIQFLLDLHTTEHGYTEVSPPYLVARDCMIGTGQLPKFEDDMYGLEEGALFLAPTAEVPVTNLVRERILPLEELPTQLTAHTPCFRREAGSAGRESKGLIRMHQFDKVELVKIVEPKSSEAELESLLLNAEMVLQKLGLHYRVIDLCTGDLSVNATRTYDIEVWAPGHGAYLEVSSCSNFGDYQARRMNVRYKNAEGKNTFPHTLNGSGTALPRLYVALLETYQQADGSIKIPEALQPYFGANVISA